MVHRLLKTPETQSQMSLYLPGSLGNFQNTPSLSETREAGATYWLGLQEKDEAWPLTPLLVL